MALTATAESVATKLQLNGQQYCFVRVEDHTRFTYVDPNGELICGGYDHHKEVVRPGPRLVRLHTLMYPTPAEWDTLLPLIGYTESTDVWTPKDTLTSFNAQVDYAGTDVGNYDTGVVDQAIIRGQQGLAPVSLELQMVFQDYDLDTAFSATAVTHDAPYEFTADAFQLGNTGADTRLINSFVISHNNNIKPRFNNSTTATNLAMTQRVIHLGVNTPFTSSEGNLLTDAVSDTTRLSGQEATLTFTRSPKLLKFEFAHLMWETQPPSIARKDAELRLMQFYKAYKDSSTAPLTITSTLS